LVAVSTYQSDLGKTNCIICYCLFLTLYRTSPASSFVNSFTSPESTS
jgi:hypothetical protein